MASQATPLSFTGLVKGLAVDESISRTERIPIGSKRAKSLAEELSKLRNTVNQAVSRAKRKEDGSDFRVESGVFINDDRTHILVVAAVTKLAGGSPDVVVVEDDDDDDMGI